MTNGNGITKSGVAREVKRWSDGVIAVGVLAILTLAFNNRLILTDIQLQQVKLEASMGAWRERLTDPQACLPGAVCRNEFDLEMKRLNNTLIRVENKIDQLEKEQSHGRSQ